MATMISIGFVELLKWISGFLASARVVLNALVYNPLVHKGSQWAFHNASVPKDGREGLANRISVRMGIRIHTCNLSDIIEYIQ